MTVNGISGANTQMGQTGMNPATDSYSRSLKNQIAEAQKQLQELSSNEDMTLEEKIKKRQEIQQQISDLNTQLRQHQIEQRREQQAKASSMDDRSSGTGSTRTGNHDSGLSQAGMAAMLSADSSIKRAKAQGGVSVALEGRTGVLEAEIQLDGARGHDTRKKEEELAEVTQKAQTATASEFSGLADAGRTMEEAAQADDRAEQADDEGEKTTAAEKKAAEAAEAEAAEKQQPTYSSVDIRL